MPMRRGKAGKGFLARLLEQSFLGQFCLEFLERLEQRAQSGAAHGFHAELVFAARFVQGDQRAHLHMHAVFRPEINILALVAEHGATHLGLAVLEGEVPVAGGGAREVGDFATDPQEGKGLFQHCFGMAVEFADRENRRRHWG